MSTQTNDIRTLSAEEYEGASGGLGWFALALALGGGATFGGILGYCTAPKKEEVLVPKIELPD